MFGFEEMGTWEDGEGGEGVCCDVIRYIGMAVRREVVWEAYS